MEIQSFPRQISAYRGKIFQNALRILQRISLHVVMRSESQKVMQGYNIGWDLQTNKTTLSTANSVRGWADITTNEIQ